VSRDYPTEWTNDEIAEPSPGVDPMSPVASWESLSQQQRENFVDEKDWRRVRQEVLDAGPGSRSSLMVLEEMCHRLDLSAVEVYMLMTTRGLPSGFGVGATWVYNRRAVERWIAELGGIASVHRALEAHLAHRERH
jgi:hypothetical protein